MMQLYKQNSKRKKKSNKLTKRSNEKKENQFIMLT